MKYHKLILLFPVEERRARMAQHPHPPNQQANHMEVDVARHKLTHIGKFSQALSYFIPILRELIVRGHPVIARDLRTLKVIFLTYHEKWYEKKFHDGK